MPEPDSGAGNLDAQVWLTAFRRACDRVAGMVRAMPPERRREPVGRGAGGDITVAVDIAAEDIVIAELEAMGVPLTLVSEEAGTVAIGGGGRLVVVVDPIDGSLNAKRGLPIFATSIALADGPTMGDVILGVVRDHGTGEEWIAVRGRGATLDGVALAPRPPDEGFVDVLMVEGAFPARLAAVAEMLDGRVGRIRAIGSLALSLCQTAAGRGDAALCLGPGRTVDVAAGQLIAREAGLLVGLPGSADLAGIPLDLDVRFHVTAAHDAETLDLLGRVAAR